MPLTYYVLGFVIQLALIAFARFAYRLYLLERNTTEAQRRATTNVHYKPLPMMTAYKEYGWDIKDFPNAYDYYHNLITLPLHTCLSDADVDYVCECFRKAVKESL